MECPNCKHATNSTAILQCSHCGEAFERGPLEEFQHLEYLVRWLGERSEISAYQKSELISIVKKNQRKLSKQLLPKIEPKPEPAEPPVDKAQAVPAPAPVSTPKPTPAPKPVPLAPAPVSASPAPTTRTLRPTSSGVV